MKRIKKKLRASDFAGDGEPYTEVDVTISIRIVGKGINRSRLAVNIHPDPALESLAKKAAGREHYGQNQDDVLTVCLSKNLSGWEDMNKDYPMFNEGCKDAYKNGDSRRMNKYISESVEWALALHRKGMEEAEQSEPGRTPPRGLVM